MTMKRNGLLVRGAVGLALLAALAAPVCAVPSAAGDAFAMRVNATLEVAAPGVLGNDPPTSGLSAAVEAGPSHGRVLLSRDGSFTYTPDGGFVGTDTFTYRAYGAEGRSDPVTVTITVEAWPYPRLVINEVEINPDGTDSGCEWVELFNATDRPIDLDGWRVTYTYRGPGTEPLAQSSRVIAPGGYSVFTYPGIRLVNATLARIQLFDARGVVVDETPAFTDEAGDAKTWQRFPNGGDPTLPEMWLFREGTKGKPLVLR
jgi:hypothetical protein